MAAGVDMIIRSRWPVIALIIVACLCGLSGQARAANWLMLQGTEHPLMPAHRPWGFIQPAFTHDSSAALSGLTDGPPDFSVNNGERLAISSVAPWFDEAERLHLRRARFGIRGVFTGAY
jgi:hypothetical protein